MGEGRAQLSGWTSRSLVGVGACGWTLRTREDASGGCRHDQSNEVARLDDVVSGDKSASTRERAATSLLAAASVVEIARLYGLRMWVEQSYKQVKGALGWAEYQVRSDVAMRRHWVLVWCAFSFCWWHLRHGAEEGPPWLDEGTAPVRGDEEPSEEAGRGKKSGGGEAATRSVLAGSTAQSAGVVGAVAHARALLAGVVAVAPTT